MRLFQNKNDLLAFRWYFDKYGDAVEVLVTVLWVIGFHVSNEARNSWTLTEKAIWAQIGRQIETERGGKKTVRLTIADFTFCSIHSEAKPNCYVKLPISITLSWNAPS